LSLKIGDTVCERDNCYSHGINKIGLVVEIKESEIYDRGERVIVAWSCGGKSYEKESHLEKKN